MNTFLAPRTLPLLITWFFMTLWLTLAPASVAAATSAARHATASHAPDHLGAFIQRLPERRKQLAHIKKYNIPETRAEQIIDSVNKWSAERDLDPRLLFALITKESGFRAKAVSPDGSKGLMQVRSAYHKTRMKSLGVHDVTSVDQNVKTGSHILREYIDKNQGSLFRGLTAYSGGSRKYAKSVLAIRRNLPF